MGRIMWDGSFLAGGISYWLVFKNVIKQSESSLIFLNDSEMIRVMVYHREFLLTRGVFSWQLKWRPEMN